MSDRIDLFALSSKIDLFADSVMFRLHLMMKITEWTFRDGDEIDAALRFLGLSPDRKKSYTSLVKDSFRKQAKVMESEGNLQRIKITDSLDEDVILCRNAHHGGYSIIVRIERQTIRVFPPFPLDYFFDIMEAEQ